MGTVTKDLWSGYWGQMKEDIKSCQLKLKQVSRTNGCKVMAGERSVA